MAQLMLINPRHKKRRVHRAKRRVHRVKRRARPVTVLAANPRKKRRRVAHARKGFAHRVQRARRSLSKRSGFAGSGGFLKNTIMPSAVGAGGALGLDLLLGYLPLPAIVQTGPMRPFVRLAGAIALGMIAGKITNKQIGGQVAAGAVTVVLYDTLKGVLKTAMPTLPLSGVDGDYPNLEYLSPGYPVGEYVGGQVVQPMGEYVGQTMGEYVGM